MTYVNNGGRERRYNIRTNDTHTPTTTSVNHTSTVWNQPILYTATQATNTDIGAHMSASFSALTDSCSLLPQEMTPARKGLAASPLFLQQRHADEANAAGGGKKN